MKGQALKSRWRRRKWSMVTLPHRRNLLLGFFVLLLAGCGPRPRDTPLPPTIRHTGPAQETAAPPEAVGRLLQLMRDRLALMHDVARSKWNSRRPVADLAREKAMLEDMAERGRAHGLDPAQTRAFFAAQVEAAKGVQEDDTRRWQAEGRGPFENPPDLPALRRRIDTLNLDLLAALASARPLLHEEALRAAIPRWAEKAIAGEGISDAVRATAIRPLVQE
jgi:chorismate mutase-like protein